MLQLGELARQIGAELSGDPEQMVDRVEALRDATPGSVSFLANRAYARYLGDTRATAVILAPEDCANCPVASLTLTNPYLGYARAAAALNPQPPTPSGVHPSACISPGAEVDESAWIGPQAVVEEGARVAADAFVGPCCVISAGASVGIGSRLVANVTVGRRVQVGRRALLHPGVVLGADGFGIANDDGVWVKVPQLGSVRIGDDVEIGANTTVDRGALGDTVLEDGVKLDNQVQIAHNVVVGAHTAVAGCVAIAGSARIGRRCMIGGGAAIAGHLEIADDVYLTATSAVASSIAQAGVYSSGMPVQENRAWRKTVARLRQLDDIARRLKRLEKQIR